MATRNDQGFIKGAIASILNQTESDFEFIIINDASTDDTPKIINEFAKLDQRIKIINNKTQLNLAGSLNEGLNIAKGKYIARMDGDDFCAPERFEKQLTFLKNNPEIGCVGTRAKHISKDGNKDLGIWMGYLTHGLLTWHLLFEPVLLHPSIIIKKELLDIIGGYDDSYFRLEDVDLCTKLIQVTKIANIPEALVSYRIRSEEGRKKINKIDAPFFKKIQLRYMETILGERLEEDIFDLIQHAKNKKGEESLNSNSELIFNACNTHLKLLQALDTKGHLSQNEKEIISNKIFTQYTYLMKNGKEYIKNASPPAPSKELSLIELAYKYWGKRIPYPLYSLAVGIMHPIHTIKKIFIKSISILQKKTP